jgi:hypothetical protein
VAQLYPQAPSTHFVAFYDMHGLQWDYSFPRSPHGDVKSSTALKCNSLSCDAPWFHERGYENEAVISGVEEMSLLIFWVSYFQFSLINGITKLMS